MLNQPDPTKLSVHRLSWVVLLSAHRLRLAGNRKAALFMMGAHLVAMLCRILHFWPFKRLSNRIAEAFLLFGWRRVITDQDRIDALEVPHG